MAKKTKAEVAQAREYVLDTLGIDPADATAWIAAKTKLDRIDNARRDYYHAQQNALRDARVAKGETTGEDYPELDETEYKAATATVPACEYEAIEASEARVAYNDIDNKIAKSRRVYCIVRHVSSSGMSRVISLHTIQDGDIRHLSYNAATVLGRSYNDKHGGVKIDGCGMDMCYALVSDLSYAMFGNAYLLRSETI